MSAPIKRRQQATRDGLAREGLEALLVFGKGVVGEYGAVMSLTGFFPSHKGVYVLVARDEPVLVIAASEGDRRWIAERVVDGVEVIAAETPGLEGYLETVTAKARAAAPEGRLGLATGAGGIPADHLAQISERLGYEPTDANALLTAARVPIDQNDVRGMETAARAADAGLEAFSEKARIGMTEWEASAIIDAELRSRGAHTTLVHVAGGRFWGQMGSKEPFREGDLVTAIAEMVSADGYWVEIGGIFSCGEPSAENIELANSCITLLDWGRDLLSPGSRAADVAEGLVGTIKQAGGDPIIGLGHGVGLDEAPPVITPIDQGLVAANTAFSLHPSIDVGERSVAVANTFVIGSDGARALSEFPRELRRISA